MINPISFIVWNIRVEINPTFRSSFMELIQNHNPWMVALIETKMLSHKGLKDEFGFDEFLEVQAIGRFGGLVLIWNTVSVTDSGLRKSYQEVHAMIQVHPKHKSWCLSIIYASTDNVKRQNLWDNLENISLSLSLISRSFWSLARSERF